MCIKIYLAPSINYRNIGIGEFGSEEYRCGQIADIVEKKLSNIKEIDIRRNRYRFDYPSEIAEDANNYINNNNEGYYISIHTNFKEKQGIGGYCKGEVTEDNQSFYLAKNIQDEIERIYNRKDKVHSIINGNTVSAEISKINAKAAIIEIGSCTNTHDANFIVNNIEAIATSIVKGIIKSCNKDYNVNIKGGIINMLSRNNKSHDIKNSNEKIKELEGRVGIIEEKLEGLAEYLKIKEVNIEEVSSQVAGMLEIKKK